MAFEGLCKHFTAALTSIHETQTTFNSFDSVTSYTSMLQSGFAIGRSQRVRFSLRLASSLLVKLLAKFYLPVPVHVEHYRLPVLSNGFFTKTVSNNIFTIQSDS